MYIYIYIYINVYNLSHLMRFVPKARPVLGGAGGDFVLHAVLLRRAHGDLIRRGAAGGLSLEAGSMGCRRGLGVNSDQRNGYV